MARRLKAVDIERLENTSFASAAGLAGGPQAQADSLGCQQCSVVSCVAYSCNSGCSGASCQNCTGVTVVGVPPAGQLVGAVTAHTNDAQTLYTCPPPPPGCGNPYTCAQATCGGGASMTN